MGIFKTVFYSSTFVTLGGYYYIHHNLSKQYPDIPTYELPPHSRIASKFKEVPKGTTISYCDSFKISLDAAKVNSLEQVRNTVFKHPLIRPTIETKDQPSASSVLRAEVQDTVSQPVRESTVLKWGWKSPKYVQYFEKLSSYGFPWRLMNGGFHELYIEKVGSEKIDVYFSTAYEYNDLRDGKLFPKLVQNLHRDYGRFLLELSLGQWK